MSEHPGILFSLMIGAAALLTSLLFAGLAGLGGAGLAGLSATLIGALSACIFFITELGQVPLSSLLIVALALASAVGFVRTAFSYRREQRLLHALPLEPIEDGALAELAQSAGARHVYMIPARLPAAFCFGLIRPRVAISSGLLERLTPDEQAAVVWHEAQHARVHEPLRCLIGRLTVGTFFWIPALRDLLDRYLLAKELAADSVAMQRTSRRALVGALHEVIAQPSPSGAIGVADVAGARIDRLLEPAAKLPPLFTRTRVTISVLAIALLGVALAFPAKLSPTERAPIDPMLTTMSLHGLPGMTVGLVLNAAILTCLALGMRRFASRHVR